MAPLGKFHADAEIPLSPTHCLYILTVLEIHPGMYYVKIMLKYSAALALEQNLSLLAIESFFKAVSRKQNWYSHTSMCDWAVPASLFDTVISVCHCEYIVWSFLSQFHEFCRFADLVEIQPNSYLLGYFLSSIEISGHHLYVLAMWRKQIWRYSPWFPWALSECVYACI